MKIDILRFSQRESVRSKTSEINKTIVSSMRCTLIKLLFGCSCLMHRNSLMSRNSKELLLGFLRFRRMYARRVGMGEVNRGERLQIMLTPEELRAIDTWRFTKRMPSRASAIRE